VIASFCRLPPWLAYTWCISLMETRRALVTKLSSQLSFGGAVGGEPVSEKAGEEGSGEEEKLPLPSCPGPGSLVQSDMLAE
jgi:hypothetical protein